MIDAWDKWFYKNINYGFKPDEPSDKDYGFLGGKLSGEILQPNGQWAVPVFEAQNRGFEPYACVSFGLNSIIEIMYKKRYGIEPNYSDRYLAKMSGTTIGGNSPRVVSDVLRKESGAVDEGEWPYVNTWDMYYAEIPAQIKEKGAKWLGEYEFGYEKVEHSQIIDALQYSPVGCSVAAWFQEGEMYYKPKDVNDNHFCVIVGYSENEYWLVFDTYEDEIKKLVWDYDFGYLARYHFVKRITALQQKIGILQQIVALYEKVVALFKQKKELELLPIEPIVEEVKPEPIPEPPKYLWGTFAEARHSARTIMDDYNLTWAEKNLLCAVIQAESNFNVNAINTITKDYGICQINFFYWIGEGKYFASIEEVMTQPEKSIRFMIEQYRAGHLNYWVAYNNGSYKQYL